MVLMSSEINFNGIVARFAGPFQGFFELVYRLSYERSGTGILPPKAQVFLAGKDDANRGPLQCKLLNIGREDVREFRDI